MLSPAPVHSPEAPYCLLATSIRMGGIVVTLPLPTARKLSDRDWRALDLAIGADHAGLTDRAQGLIERLESRLGMSDLHRAHGGAISLEALTERAHEARRRQTLARKAERTRAKALAPAGDFGPDTSDLMRLRKAQEGVANAQRLYRMGDLSAARECMGAARKTASKAESDWRERRRAAWLTKAIAESNALERLRGGAVREEQVHNPQPGEGRTRLRRETDDCFRSLWKAGVLGETGKRDDKGKPVRNTVLGQRRYAAGRRYRELVEAGRAGVKSGLNFGTGGSGGMDGIAAALAHVNAELRRLEKAVRVGGVLNLTVLRLVVGEGRPLSYLGAPGSAHDRVKAALWAALDTIAEVAGGRSREAVQALTEHVLARQA